MQYWHSIAGKYDGKDPTYSQLSLVLVLFYLLFGRDYPYHIAKNFEIIFRSLGNPSFKGKFRRGSVLISPGKLNDLLRKLEESGFVLSTPGNGMVKRYYEVNPQVILSPSKTGPYHNEDGKPFEIPSDLVYEFLAWARCLGDTKRNSYLKELISAKDRFNLWTFLSGLKLLVSEYELGGNKGLSSYIEAYVDILEEIDRSLLSPTDKYYRKTLKNTLTSGAPPSPRRSPPL